MSLWRVLWISLGEHGRGRVEGFPIQAQEDEHGNMAEPEDLEYRLLRMRAQW